jgi:hypothetical protein
MIIEVKLLLARIAKHQNLIGIVFIVFIVSAVGTYFLVNSRAATPYAGISADQGSLASGANMQQNCAGASDGNCVCFNNSIPIDATVPDDKVTLALCNTGTPFSATSFWNTPVPTDPPLNPNSSAYVSTITNQLASGSPDGNLNTARYSSPIYIVPANQPRVPVILNSTSTGTAVTNLQTAFSQGVPIPANAMPAGGTDAHLAIYQPSSDTLWEFWRLSTPADNAPGAGQLPWSITETALPSYGDSQWHTVWGGVMTKVSQGDGVFPNPYAGWTTGLSLLGTVIRIDELQAGSINHVMGLGLSYLLNEHVIPADNCSSGGTLVNMPGATNGISWPADRSDGTNTDPCAIPEGLRFVLPSTFDLTQYNAQLVSQGQAPLTPVAMAIAVAAQKYGFVVSETSNTVVDLSLGDPTPYTVAGLPNPYTSGPGVGGVNDGNKGLFDGVSGNNQNAVLMANFPWGQLEALPFNYGEPN